VEEPGGLAEDEGKERVKGASVETHLSFRMLYSTIKPFRPKLN
jgi:hypothetical protein